MSVDPHSLSGWERVLIGAVGGAVGVILGFLLNEVKNVWWRRKRHLGFWRAIEAEIEFARFRADGFLTEKIAAPLYRFPDSSFRTCFPKLLSDGAVSRDEVTVLVAFFSELETLNRGLDRAAEVEDDTQRLHEEYGRNRKKATRLAEKGPTYQAAKTAVGRHVK